MDRGLKWSFIALLCNGEKWDSLFFFLLPFPALSLLTSSELELPFSPPFPYCATVRF